MAKVKAETSKATKHMGATILVADDDPEILALLSMRLARRGFRVIEAHDGNQAVDLALVHQPALVLLDVMMPGRNGWEVARTLRQDPATASTKIVVLTAIGARVNELTSPMYEVDAYLDKPFEFTRVEQTIEDALDAAGAPGRAAPAAKVVARTPATRTKAKAKAPAKARSKAPAKSRVAPARGKTAAKGRASKR